MSINNASFISKTNDYGTPEYVLVRVRVAFQGEGITLDPASSFEHNERVGAQRFLDRSQDGLNEKWYGNVFVNPPYGRNQSLWVSKAFEEFKARRIKRCVLLLGSALHTEWFRPYWSFPICVVQPRIQFIGGSSSNSHDNIIVAFGVPDNEFWEAFQSLGRIICPVDGYSLSVGD